DVDNLARFLKRISSQYRYGRDLTLNGLKKAISEVLVAFPVYCTYINQGGITKTDLKYIQQAIQTAKRQIPQLVNELNLIEKFLLLEYEYSLPEEERAQWLHFVMRLQQFTGPLMAKGIEDTLFYVYSRFISLNEVGGSPNQFGVSAKAFHQYHQSQVEHWPQTMNTTSTHDTKRSEDVRARLNVLSELPERWAADVKTWSQLNSKLKQTDGDRQIPDANDEYFLYQTLVGAYPFDEADLPEFTERIKAYVVKAVREAKVHTAWLQPDSAYEEGFVKFVDQILKPGSKNKFLSKFRPFWEIIADYGLYNSLSQTLLKITAPGLPDFYQGTEFWDFSLVDPDNRRPVDYKARMASLKALKSESSDILGLCTKLLDHRQDGRIKQFMMMRALAVRNQYRAVFEKGSYIPVQVMGPYEGQVIAFARQHEQQTVVTVVPRYLTELIKPGKYPLGEAVWADTVIEIPNSLVNSGDAPWQEGITEQNLGTGNVFSVGQILHYFPVALLVNEGAA
ncbi:MAG: malto-oligosyltrehalose synthase, partial [Cyanobacteria bacterium P01_G01_bin.38]